MNILTTSLYIQESISVVTLAFFGRFLYILYQWKHSVVFVSENDTKSIFF